jgi:hypothetical protein
MSNSRRHNGELLKKLVEASGLSKTFIARKAGYSRGMYYTHIKDKDLSPGIFAKYRRVLGQYLPDEVPDDLPELAALEANSQVEDPQTLRAAVQQIAYWKNKYIELVEKYNAYLEAQNRTTAAGKKRSGRG